jgi:hypothetical protein
MAFIQKFKNLFGLMQLIIFLFSEQQMVMAGNTKIKEIRQELNQEKMKYQALEKSYKDKMEYQVLEEWATHFQ